MKYSPSSAEFMFRVWVHPKDGDPPEIEVWYDGIESSNGRYVSEWAHDAMSDLDMHEIFNLQEDGDWQVVGRATVRGWQDYFGEYDEEVSIVSFTKESVVIP